ncbi:hypothetical protein scyTo_0010663, partial [Scyliorhinus torazame]|nr:hypothetical protein [Scyliorhinus torazame]
TLCILANIADGTTAKDLIMTNDDILQKIKYYMGHSNVKLQLAATLCISNLIWSEEEGTLSDSPDHSPGLSSEWLSIQTRKVPGLNTGSHERQDKLREMGIADILHKLVQSTDPNLCDKAKTALQQFLS